MNFKILSQVVCASIMCLSFAGANALANENVNFANTESAQNAINQPVSPYRADFIFALEGPKSSVHVEPFDPEHKQLLEKIAAEEAERNRGDRRDNRRDDRRDDRRDGRGQGEERPPVVPQDISFDYAFKTPYYFTENGELMLDVLEIADLYEPNLLVTYKEEILTLQYTITNKKTAEITIPAVGENVDAASSVDVAPAEGEATAPANSEAEKEEKLAPIPMTELTFNKEVFVLTVDMDDDESAGLLTHTVYAPVVIQEKPELAKDVVEPTFTVVDEAKSFKNKAVTLNAPIEIIENYLFAPISVVTNFNETIQKDATTLTVTSNIADKANVKKLSQIKNETKEIEKKPEFLSKENFELIYAMIGPAGAAIVLLVFVATYLALKNFYYLTFVWLQFKRKFKKYDNECTMLDEEKESKNPLIQLIKEITSLKIKDPTALRIEVAFIFQRNLEMVVQDLSYIRLISVISPLLGLLGTVLGMVDVFQAIAESSSPDPADLAAGIWSALLTTILGLSVAVPTLIVYYYLLLKFKRYQNRAVTYSIRLNEECSEYEKI